MSTRRLICPSGPRFFGLTSSDKDIFLEQIFALMYYVGFSYKEAYDLPVWIRSWFIKRTSEEFKRAAEKGETPPSRAAHHNDPSTRSLQGQRPHTPARLRRFT